MRRGWTPGRLAVAIVAAAALVRIGFVMWAPRELSGDALHYHMSAVGLSQGSGYSEWDGSPSIRWMPGWPYLLAASYRMFGVAPIVPMFLNALAGAATAAMLIRLGALWFGAACGLWAGALYAAWPGNIYYTATLMTEPVFNALFVACLLALAEACADGSGRRRRIWTATAGFALGSAAIVKAEPWVLLPVLLAFVWIAFPRGRRARSAALFLLTASLWLVPWTVRNYRAFDRFVPTTATAGANAWLGNHPGASGGQSIGEMKAFMARHRRDTVAQTLFAASDTGWSEVGRFYLEHPGESVSILANKLAMTYGSDGHGARLVRGVGVGPVGYISEAERRTLERIADVYWAGIALLVLLGVAGLRAWSTPARIICLGVPLAWMAVHLVFLGGPRFHVPETPVYALIAGFAIGRRIDAREVRAVAGQEE